MELSLIDRLPLIGYHSHCASNHRGHTPHTLFSRPQLHELLGCSNYCKSYREVSHANSYRVGIMLRPTNHYQQSHSGSVGYITVSAENTVNIMQQANMTTYIITLLTRKYQQEKKNKTKTPW